MTAPPDLVVSAPQLLLDGVLVGPAAVAVAEGRIVRISNVPPARGSGHVALDSGVLTPGLVDLQNNGCFGADFATAGLEGYRKALAGLAARGVTSVMPTVVTAPLDAIAAAIARCAAAAEALEDEPVTRILGVHVEGPFLSPAWRGAHRAEWMRDPSPDALDELLGDAASRRMLRLITLAPERPHALDAIRRLDQAGVIVSIGHSDATHEQVAAAAEAGARMVTHLFNAQRPFRHRDPGVPGAALTDPRLYVGLIVDGVHVHELACRLAYQAAPGRIVAVSDSILIAGMPPGTEREFGAAAVVVDESGAGRRPDGTLAGSGIVLDEGVRRMIRAGIDPARVLASATETAARALGRDDIGRLATGAVADLVWWDEAFCPRRVWLGGRELSDV